MRLTRASAYAREALVSMATQHDNHLPMIRTFTDTVAVVLFLVKDGQPWFSRRARRPARP